MATRKIIDYSDFSGGEYGILEPWRAPQGTWTGKNIVKYDNGSLGPRNGLKKITLSGDTTNFLGTIISTGAYSRRTDSALWALLDNSGTRKAFTITRAGVIDELTLTDAVPAATEPISSLVYEDIEYLTIVSNGLYTITGGAFAKREATSNEHQSITIGGSGLTSFTLTYSGQTTGAIAAAADAATIQTALEALSNLAPGDVIVTGAVSGPFDVEFAGTLAYTNVAQMTATPTGGSGTVTIATTTIGGSGSPGCRAFCQYGDRFFAGGGDTGGVPKGPDGVTCSANRLWYSSPASPTDWPMLNYIDVTGAIVGLFPQRTHLVIVTTEGWWVLTGVPGITDTLRRPSKSEFPTWPTQGTILEPSCNLAFVHGSLQQRDGEAEGEIATHSLGRFTGTTIEYATHLPFGSGENYTTYPPTYSAVTLRGPEDWLVQGGLDTAPNRAVFYRSGGWQKIEWQIASTTLLGWCITMRRTDVHQFWANGAASTAPKLYEWQAYNNRPAFTGDTKKGPGDDSSTPFTAEITLPEYHEDDGRNVGIVDVVVDFTSWSTGSGSTNHFDLVPTVFRTFGDAAQAATTWSFDEAGASSAATLAGTRRRKRFQVVGRDLEGTGFQLKFQNIRGVAINRVQVYGDVDGPRVGE